MVSGLRDVVAADSAITSIDGEGGALRYRGYPVQELAEGATFEEVAFLIWHGELPTADELSALRARLAAARRGAGWAAESLQAVPSNAHPLDVLRFLVADRSLQDPLAWDNRPEANTRKAEDLTAWFPVAVAALHRLRAGQQLIEPRPDLDGAANMLWMLHGREPDPLAVRTLDTSLVLHAEHELNASTFAARVTIATQSTVYAAVISALGALAGPRHGGASDRVIRMLEEIGAPTRAEAWAPEELSRHERIMGFGHPVYRTVDPRSRVLRAMAERLLAGTPREPWIAILVVLTEVMRRERNLYPNVDLWAAVVNHALGIAPDFYTSIFACSRIVGWTAHAIEQLDGRLIRPVARYQGPAPRALESAMSS